MLTRPARDVYTVNQSDPRVSIWSEARCGLAVGDLGEIFRAWKAVAGCQPQVAAPRAGVAVDGDDDADIATYNMVVLGVRRRSGGGIWAACEAVFWRDL